MKQLRTSALAALLTVGVFGTALADTDFGARARPATSWM
jgi:hypothetical protein